MKKITTRTLELKGTSYEIGRTLGTALSPQPSVIAAYTAGMENFGTEEVRAAEKMFEQWCPGLNEELAGFADSVHVALEQIVYYAMTYLRPNCSQIALLPSRTDTGHPLLARNYEFNDEAEDFSLIKTSVTGKYTHMGTSVLSFGRDDGFNECGLAVTMSSCGFPVGALKYMRKPALYGLQFWAVIRSVLENCRDVVDALHFLKEMPISYNLNLMLLDKSGTCALVETLDGRMAVRVIGSEPGESDEPNESRVSCVSNETRASHEARVSHLCATNHALFKELAVLEPQAMAHSLRRFEYMENALKSRSLLSADTLKELLLSPYPDGLCCHHYKDFFGTTKSMIIDPVDGTIELCWGGRIENGWHTYRLADPLKFSEHEIELDQKAADPAMFRFLPYS